MKKIKSFILKHAPYWIKDQAITWYNTKLYRERHAGIYKEMLFYFSKWENASYSELQKEADRRKTEFLRNACMRSKAYSSFKGKNLSEFPIVEKESLIKNLKEFATIAENEGIASLTGGTTGASMKVIYRNEDLQERNALLDHFRKFYGYKLGEKVAWFSGKEIATQKDVNKGRCYVDDKKNQIRFFSTFLINRSNFESYWRALSEFKPKFIVGFPSSVLDIAQFAQEKNLKATWKVDFMFPTAETVLPTHRETIGSVFGCRLINQYASSEGAPFILECPKGNLHIHPLSGIFEVLDESGNPSQEGEMVVTSFSTSGTPLIRYRIGDRMRLSDENKKCTCQWNFPLVEFIEGRTTDFIYSKENGKVNLGNLSNCTKEVEGIISFQVQQDDFDEIIVRVISDKRFNAHQKNIFSQALRVRVGDSIRIKLEEVNEISREKSGKFRIVKNNIHHLINQYQEEIN